MKLYSFFNSSTSYRVRIALALKGLDYEYHPVNIRVGEHRADAYVDLNASASVPTLVDGEVVLGQSLAIMDYLDNRYPEPRLIPDEPLLRAHVLEFASVIACDIHPVNNLRVLGYLRKTMNASDEAVSAWYAHWVEQGLAMAERLLKKQQRHTWCFGEQPSLADICLIPQLANARRMGCDLSSFEQLLRVEEGAREHPAFQAAAPERQPDFKP